MDEKKLSGEFILNPEHKEVEKHKPAVSKHSPHFYSSFCKNPLGVRFKEQEEGEEILLLLRRHFVTNIPWLVFAFFLIALPLILPFVIAFFPFPLPSANTLSLYLAFYYLAIFGFLLINFSLWYFHIGLVTSFRVIDIDLAGILYRQVIEAKHENIEDVKYNQVGFITSLFNYGNVTVQTAGNDENIEYDRVPQPSEVADIIGDLSQHS